MANPSPTPNPPPKNTRHAILDILKREGAQETRTLAERLGLTTMAVGLQLSSLSDEKLVASEPEPARPGQRGRPVHRWKLTEAANRIFPDAHALLTTGLLDSFREIYGAQGIQKLLDTRTRHQEEEYAREMPKGGLKEKVKALARLRDREGYMTEVESLPKGGFRLIENHCPICTAAKSCQGFCQSEWQVFSRLMGPDAKVTREEHLLSGDRRCVYAIEPARHETAHGAGKQGSGKAAAAASGVSGKKTKSSGDES